MKTSTKLIIAGIILFFIPLGGITQIISILCIIGAIVLIVAQSIDKKSTSAKDYRAEARKACEKITPKPGKNATPPWEG